MESQTYKMLGFVLLLSVFVYGIWRIRKTVRRYFLNADVKRKGRRRRRQGGVEKTVTRAPAVQLSSPKFLELQQTDLDEDVFVGKQKIENVHLFPVCYNIKAMNPEPFTVTPRRGVIEPGNCVEVTFYFNDGDCRYGPEKIEVEVEVKVWRPSLPYAEQRTTFNCIVARPVEDNDESTEEDDPNFPKWEILMALLVGVFIVVVAFPCLQWYVIEPLARWIAYERMPYRCKLLYQLSPTASITAGFLGCPRWVFT